MNANEENDETTKENKQKNSEKKVKMTKTYVISKDTDENDLIKVRDYFNDPKEYFNIDESRVVFGQHPFPLRKNKSNTNLNSKTKVIETKNEYSAPSNPEYVTSSTPNKNFTNLPLRPTTARLPPSHFRPTSNTKTITTKTARTFQPRQKVKNLTSKDFRKKDIHYDLLSNIQLKEKENLSKQREAKSLKIGTDNLLSKFANAETREQFVEQEKMLKNQVKSSKKFDRISSSLAKKLKRKETDLLYNKTDEYRLKKQMLNFIDNEKPIHEKYGLNYWMFSLRRPKHLDYLRVNYINVGTPEKEIWKPFIEFPYQPVETIQNPKTLVKNKFSNVINDEYYQDEIKRIKCKLPNMEGINSLCINGENLLKEEFKFLQDEKEQKDNTKVRRVYRDPFEERKNYVNEMTIKAQYDNNDKVMCKCRNISARTCK